MKNPTMFQFGDLSGPVALGAPDTLLPVLRRVLHGWPITPVAHGHGEPLIRLNATASGYVRTSPWVEDGPVVLTDPVDAVCDLLLDLERAYIAASGSYLALHAAAVAWPDGLCIFPSTHESGKSVLSVALAAAGRRVFSDDMLAYEPALNDEGDENGGVGVAPGIQPRLRLPLATGLDKKTRALISANPGPASESFQYVALDDALLAPLGERAPITRVVVLAREPGAKVSLDPLSESEALKQLVLQSFGREVPALEMLDHLHALVRSTECHVLHYDRVGDAVALLDKTFSP